MLKRTLLIYLLLFLSCDPGLFQDGNEEPETTITSANLDGSTITTTTLTISFEGDDQVIEFSYNLDNSEYSHWSSSNQVTLDYLDEGLHTFSVKGRYATGEEDNTPASTSFTVNAVTGPALMFHPRREITFQNNIVTFQLLAEEVENLMLATINISYDNTQIEIMSVIQGDMFTGSGESVFISEEDTNSLSIHTMLLGGDRPSVSGTGVLAEITIKSKALGSTSLNFNGTQVFKTHEDRLISIQETVNGLVVIE